MTKIITEQEAKNLVIFKSVDTKMRITQWAKNILSQTLSGSDLYKLNNIEIARTTKKYGGDQNGE